MTSLWLQCKKLEYVQYIFRPYLGINVDPETEYVRGPSISRSGEAYFVCLCLVSTLHGIKSIGG